MSMQMDAYFKTGQIGTLFVHVELLHGGSSGGWVGQGGPCYSGGLMHCRQAGASACRQCISPPL